MIKQILHELAEWAISVSIFITMMTIVGVILILAMEIVGLR